jgi:gliding motility-associated-like protein
VASTYNNLIYMKKQLRDFFKFAKNLKNLTSTNPIVSSKSVMILLLLTGGLVHSQAPGCPSVYAGEDVMLDCDEPCTDLTATFLDTGETNSYEVLPITYDPPFPFTGLSNPVSVGADDIWSEQVNLPFEFSFFGVNYDRVFIGSNGIISFNTQTPGGFCAWSLGPTDLIPTSAIHQNAVMLYHDMDPRFGDAEIGYEVIGESPCRTLVVSFANVPYYNGGSNSTAISTFQMVLYETTNTIEFYVETKPDPFDHMASPINGGRAVLGIQNNGGTQGYTPPNRNTSVWEATEEAWRFSPNGSSIVDFAWLDENDDVIGTTTTIEVCPTQPVTTYTARAIYNLPTGDPLIVTDDVTVTLGGGALTVDLGEDQSFCNVVSYEIVPTITGADPGDVSYLWSTGETTPTIIVTETGTYSLEITLDNCSATDEVFVEFNDNPEIDLGPDFETCFENPVFLDASPSNYPPENGTYLWTFNGVQMMEDTPVIEVNEFGTYTVTVSVGICISQDAIVISPREDLMVSLGEAVSGCTTEPKTLTATTSEEGVTFAWFLNGNLIEGQTSNTLNITLPVAPSNMPDIYSVVISKGECSGTAEVEVMALNCVISQGLSPDGSPGFNDRLDLTFLANRSGIENLQVFNRHGRVVYQQNNYVNQWAGQSDEGDILPTGTYFYVINFSTEDSVFGNQKTGWIYINRASN